MQQQSSTVASLLTTAPPWIETKQFPDAAQYFWWPKINRNIVRMCKEGKECTFFGKNLKLVYKFNPWKPLPILNKSNQEIQSDYAGPLLEGSGGQIYILIAIDRCSKYPSVLLTRATGAEKVLKFLNYHYSFYPKIIKDGPIFRF